MKSRYNNQIISLAKDRKSKSKYRYDPTHTLTLRNRFISELNRRFRKLTGDINQLVIEEDAFGLVGKTYQEKLKLNTRFAFGTSSSKIRGFSRWLNSRVDEEILEAYMGATVQASSEDFWANKYIHSSYNRGIQDASINMKKLGVDIPGDFISAAFNRPIHADRVGIAYTRTFEGMKGLTDQMRTKMSRVLAEGLAEGLNPRNIASRLKKEIKVSSARAKTIARTEVINAHAEASLNIYQEAGLEDVEVLAEWAVAGEGVCELCLPKDGKVYPIKEARGKIPFHPNCRCAFIPFIPEV